MRITASDLVRAINQLPRTQEYNYINPSTTTKIIIDDIVLPEGSIYIRRYDPTKGETRGSAKRTPISTEMLWRVANAIRPGVPLNIDRVLGASYNTRSALEALIAHTSQFYYCYPGRIENVLSSTTVKEGHKHIIYLPDSPHQQGLLSKIETEIVISEIPTAEAIYEALVLPEQEMEAGIDFEMARRHAQIQIALVQIGKQLGFRTWVAQNDKGIKYNDQKIAEMETVIARLEDEKLMAAQQEAQRAASLIDCIWFKNGRLMPAVIEIEHSTGVRSGLTRMKTFQDAFPPFPTRWVIAAPDEDREKVLRECNTPQFKSLNPLYFPYSAIEELYSLCQRRKIRGVTEEFLDCYMEKTLHLES
ncbi:MAG: restriction endonuclease [Pyrinomonadaceae bacterium]